MILFVGPLTMVMMNRYPYINGHLLVAPVRHVPGLEGLRDEEIMRTELSPISANTTITGNIIYVTLENSGQTKLADFNKWDVIVQYYDTDINYYTKWLPYTDGTPGNNEWTKEGIYLDTDNETAEVFEPAILNPGEKIQIEAKLNPYVGESTTNLVVISTPNGIPASISFSR